MALKQGVTPIGQSLYFAIKKTIEDVSWRNQDILVMDKVLVTKPYTADCVKALNEKAPEKKAIDHVRKIVEKHIQDTGHRGNWSILKLSLPLPPSSSICYSYYRWPLSLPACHMVLLAVINSPSAILTPPSVLLFCYYSNYLYFSLISYIKLPTFCVFVARAFRSAEWLLNVPKLDLIQIHCTWSKAT